MESERPVLTSTYTALDKSTYSLLISNIRRVRVSTTRSELQLGSASFDKDNHSSTTLIQKTLIPSVCTLCVRYKKGIMQVRVSSQRGVLLVRVSYQRGVLLVRVSFQNG